MNNLESSLTYLLIQISVGCRNRLQKAMNEIGLHGGQVFVLFALWKNDGQSQVELVKNLVLASPTVNKMIGSLERSGFVERRQCGGDGRVMRVYLTEAGVQAQAAVEAQWSNLDSATTANLTETEKLILHQIFGKLRDSLGRTIAAAADEG